MIKCPNCGSTAQPRKIDQRECALTKIEKYKCGCGCNFSAVWELKQIHNGKKVYNVEMRK